MRVLAVGSHPDDLELSCGGTLARMAKEGYEVYTCHVANGNMGHAVIMPDELGPMRTIEAEEAGKVLGVKKVYNVDVGDCMLYADNLETRREMVRIIREVDPDFIITHSPDDYMNDHLEVSKLVFETSFTATVGHMFPEYPATGKVVPIYYMDNLAGTNFVPEMYVDISDYIDQKLEAVECHKSQIVWMREHDKIDFIEFVRSCTRGRGLQCGVMYAEGFTTCKAHLRQTTMRHLP